MTVSLAVKVPIEERFSFKETLLVRSPASPESPVISGDNSSTSRIVIVTVCSEELELASVAAIFNE
mgnify:CR=1 FL=1